MTAALFDINFLLALAWPQHQFHSTAASWFRLHSARGWATCSVTQIGFIRLSSNRHYLRDQAKTPAEALQLLVELTSHPSHRFLGALEAPSVFPEFSRILDHQGVTDAYLVGVARVSKAKLVTFDRAISSWAGSPLVEILSPGKFGQT